MTNLVEMIAKALVDEPDKVVVTRGNLDGSDTITLQVASSDMGKVIGKQGRIAKAIRTVVKAAGVKDSQMVNVEIVSDEEMAAASTGTKPQEVLEVAEDNSDDVEKETAE